MTAWCKVISLKLEDIQTQFDMYTNYMQGALATTVIYSIEALMLQQKPARLRVFNLTNRKK